MTHNSKRRYTAPLSCCYIVSTETLLSGSKLKYQRNDQSWTERDLNVHTQWGTGDLDLFSTSSTSGS